MILTDVIFHVQRPTDDTNWCYFFQIPKFFVHTLVWKEPTWTRWGDGDGNLEPWDGFILSSVYITLQAVGIATPKKIEKCKATEIYSDKCFLSLFSGNIMIVFDPYIDLDRIQSHPYPHLRVLRYGRGSQRGNEGRGKGGASTMDMLE